MSMFRTAMGVTTASCFVCGQGTTVQFHFPRGGKKKQLLGQWRKKWSMSLCRVLQLSDSFQSIFNEASFCFNCQEAVCRAEFTVNAISRLQNEIGVIREELKGNFQSHYENLMQGRTELEASGTAYRIIEDIIMEIAIKLEPVEETVHHVLDNLEEQGYEIPFSRIVFPEEEFPRLELVDHLKNPSEFFEKDIQDSESDAGDSVLPASASKVSDSRRERTTLVRRSCRNIKSRVNLKQISGNLSDSGEDFEESGDPDFSGSEMAENDKEIAERKKGNLKRKRSPKVRLICEFEECAGKNIFFERASDLRTHVRKNHVRFNPRNSGRKKESPIKSLRNKHSAVNVVSCIEGQATIETGGTKPNLTCNHECCRGRNLEFKFLREVRAHILNFHDGVGVDKLYHCALCPCQYDRLPTLRNHINSVHLKGSSSRLVSPNHKWALNCSICLKGFDEESTLKEHEILHGPATPYACILCSEQNLNSAAHLRRHVQSAHDGKRYWCTVGPCLSSFVAFSLPREMKSHYTSEHSEEDDQRFYHCTECPSRFTVSSCLVEHLKRHNTVRSFLCVICGKTFRTEAVLKRHVSTFHTELQMKPKCSHCTKSFEGAAEVEEHEKLHSDVTPFKCVLCDKMLPSTIELQRHVAASHEVLQFECPAEGCDAKFTTKNKLEWHHVKTHAEKRHECPHCSLRFYAPSLLKTHLVIHTQERTQKCLVPGCGRRFITKFQLKKHIQTIHEPPGGETQFECRICQKRFHARFLLSQHEVHHGDARPFMCHICSAAFKSQQNLRTHLKVHAATKRSGTNLKLQRPRKARIPQIHNESLR